MKRVVEPKNRIIFPLDVNSERDVRKWVRLLKDYVGLFKVGNELFTYYGPKILDIVYENDCKVFLDLKFHDIPNTVVKASKEALKLNVSMFSVHSLGGYEMMRGSVEAIKEVSERLRPLILSVTILTSMDNNSLKEIGIYDSIENSVLRLASLSQKAGVDGVVASGSETKRIKEKFGNDFIVVTPGIRINDLYHDQKRVSGVVEAIKNGADYIVVGRPIRESKDPLKAVQTIIDDILKAEHYMLEERII
jgi:orotidine-5'-phosphate decarboxylase